MCSLRPRNFTLLLASMNLISSSTLISDLTCVFLFQVSRFPPEYRLHAACVGKIKPLSIFFTYKEDTDRRRRGAWLPASSWRLPVFVFLKRVSLSGLASYSIRERYIFTLPFLRDCRYLNFIPIKDFAFCLYHLVCPGQSLLKPLRSETQIPSVPKSWGIYHRKDRAFVPQPFEIFTLTNSPPNCPLTLLAKQKARLNVVPPLFQLFDEQTCTLASNAFFKT